jgi:N-acetylmuramic acid 6-phosphate etherase
MAAYEELIHQLRQLGTEQVNPNTLEIDRLPALEIARKINDEDATVAAVVRNALPEIAKTAELFAQTIRTNGRIFYVGAGTSGRLGVLDAAECPPTFGTDPAQIQGIISGGYETLVMSKEGVEDDREAAKEDLKKHRLSANDMVIGIAASRRTPYTLAALEYAKLLGCRTAFIICNERGSLEFSPDVLIVLPVGPEAITGSTRMKSGTAQKMTLNLISTTAMVLLGKTYGNLMVDLQSRSEKLAARSRRILVDLLQITLENAEQLLVRAGGSVKIAIVMHRFECSREVAIERLARVDGFISRITS